MYFFALKGTHFYIYLKKRVQTNFKSIKKIICVHFAFLMFSQG